MDQRMTSCEMWISEHIFRCENSLRYSPVVHMSLSWAQYEYGLGTEADRRHISRWEPWSEWEVAWQEMDYCRTRGVLILEPRIYKHTDATVIIQYFSSDTHPNAQIPHSNVLTYCCVPNNTVLVSRHINDDTASRCFVEHALQCHLKVLCFQVQSSLKYPQSSSFWHPLLTAILGFTDFTYKQSHLKINHVQNGIFRELQYWVQIFMVCYITDFLDHGCQTYFRLGPTYSPIWSEVGRTIKIVA